MSRRRMSAVLVVALIGAALVVLPGSPATALGFGEITGEVTDQSGIVRDQFSVDSAGAESFSEDETASHPTPNGNVTARATQTYTEIFSGADLTSVNVVGSARATSVPEALAGAGSHYSISFSVPEDTPFTISGSISASNENVPSGVNAVGGRITFGASFSPLFDVELQGPGSAGDSQNGELLAGTYTLDADLGVGMGTGPNGQGQSGRVEFTVDLTLGDPRCRNSFTPGPDTIEGSPEDDILCGGAGGDTIQGFGGNDTIIGGAGEDRLFGEGIVSVAGAGTDTIEGGRDEDTIDGGPENDTLKGGLDVDTIRGREGIDTILGGSGGDTIQGDDGNDPIQGGPDNDTIFGDSDPNAPGGPADEPGDDGISGDDGRDELHGGPGEDTIGGDDGRDTILGEDGPDHIFGGPDPDQALEGGDQNDDIDAGPGDDFVVLGGAGPDTLLGGPGEDRMRGEGGVDCLVGDPRPQGAQRDTLFGGPANDIFLAKDGVRDEVDGETGPDRGRFDGRDQVRSVQSRTFVGGCPS